MPRAENTSDWVEVLEQAIEGKLSSVWTALPALIVSFDAAKRTCVAQPTIQMQFCDEKDKLQWITLPVLPDVPVQFPGGGGFVLTFPLKAGDEGIVIFASRCIDHWWEHGEVQQQAEFRMHDLSDAFFIPTVRSVPNVEAGISTADAMLRAIDPAGPQVTLKADNSVLVKAPALVTVTAPTVTINGNVVINGNLTTNGNITTGGPGTTVGLNGTVSVNGEAYTAHRHSGVTTGGGNTGGKVP